MPSHTPPGSFTPDDIYTMAQHYDVDLTHEPFLIPLMKQAVTTPAMPSDPLGREDTVTERKDERYVREQMERLRAASRQTDRESSEHPTWMEFDEAVETEAQDFDKDRRRGVYYFDFATGTRQEQHPLVRLVGEPSEQEQHDASDALVPAAVADPRVFAHAAAVHSQSVMKDIKSLQILCFQSWWTETASSSGIRRRVQLRIYFSIPTRHFQVARDDSDCVFTISHVAHPTAGRPLSAWDLHEGARIPLLGRLTTLKQSTLLTRQWLALHARLFARVRSQLQDELAKYVVASHGRVDRDRGRVLCADPHARERRALSSLTLSPSGVDTSSTAELATLSLRRLLDDIRALQDKLAAFRPDVARRLCAPLLELEDVW